MLREVRCVHCIPANGVRPPPPPHSILLDSEWQNHLPFAVGILVPRLHKLRHFHGVILHRRAMQELYEI